MTRSRLPRSSKRPASGWPRWSRRTGRKNHWLAAPFSPMGRVGRLNKIFNHRDGPNGEAEWADSTRFSPPARWGYDTAEVDAFQQEIRDTFLGIKQPPLTSDEANDKRFKMARRRGYDVVQVDAFCDEAEQKLAAMRPTYRGRRD